MKKVLLIYGGTSPEHDISCISAKAIIENIDYEKYQLDCLKITKNNVWLYKDKPINNIINFLKQYDVVFPITHGVDGEDGKLQGMLDLFKIKYVGCNWESSCICMDKQRTKEILHFHNIPQVPFQIYEKSKKLNIDYPVIIKPANGGSSLGIKIANNKRELKEAIKEANKYDNKIIIEKFINAKELECAILKDKKLIISEIGEIKSANDFYDFEAKYKNKDSKTIIPAKINNKIKRQIKKYAEEIVKILEIKNFARIDFFYDLDNKKIYLNEINTIPGFTEISMYPKLIMNKGFSYKEIITSLIENA